MDIFNRKSSICIFIFCGLIFLGIVGTTIISMNNKAEKDYYIETYYTDGENKVNNVKLKIKGADVVFESRDYDQGLFLLSGKNLQNDFDVNKTDDCIYVTNKDDKPLKDAKITFTLPIYYKNKVNFVVDLEEGNVEFKEKVVNVESIVCQVIGGNIMGDSLYANKAILKVDNNHDICLKNVVADEKFIGNV